MGHQWMSDLIRLFQPEDSSGRNEKPGQNQLLLRGHNNFAFVSLKALVWTILAIVAGVIIGQLT